MYRLAPITLHPPASTFYLAGPTASGKSAVALALAKLTGGEIVNADAFQLYRGLDLLTAKPTAADLATAPHHLYSCLDPEDTCDAQRYRDLALPILHDIAARGALPIVVGGSGLYLKALTHGLDPLPPADPTLRARFASRSLSENVAELLALDPDAARNVPLQNPRYVERALEICLLTGQPQSTLRTSSGKPPPVPVRGVCLVWDRTLLHQRINDRARTMIASGALAEVANAGPLSSTLEKAIGVRELRAHLQGDLTLDEALAAIQQATRRYAKRQLTWFRREPCLQTICPDPNQTPDSLATLIKDRFHL